MPRERPKMPEIGTRPIVTEDREWVAQFMLEHWGSDKAISRGVIHYPQFLPGFVAFYSGDKVGLVTYNITGESCEIVTLDSVYPSLGVGTALIEAVKEAAIKSGCKRLWLITTNDNTNALRFYQKRGFVLVSVHRNALEQSRKLKPEIPFIGNDGIPLRDEIELEMIVNDKA
jgi:GNAT superfamily N-acetyltransferase